MNRREFIKPLTVGVDLAITTDYRDVLAEVVQKRLQNNVLADVFPDYSPTDFGLFE